MIKPENKVLFERTAYDLNRYWLTQDGLHNLDYDLFFSPFQKYTCQAGCKVCYISKELDESAKVIRQYAPVRINAEQEAVWNYWFSKFDRVGHSDDLRYIKLNFPHIHEWLKVNSNKFRYCMTDNAILRQHEILLEEMNFAGIMDISISDQFLDTSPTMWGNVRIRLEELTQKYKIDQIKFLITKPGPQDNTIAELIKWVDGQGLAYLVHYDFTDESNLKHEVVNAVNYNDWVMCQNGRLYEIQKETVQLFGDRWFFSSQDATSRSPFWIMDTDNARSLETLMYNMFLGKQENYGNMAKSLVPDSMLAEQFSAYFKIPATYKVNQDFNFIPFMLINSHSKFVSSLVAQGWLNTAQGLYKPNENGTVTSIIVPITQAKE